MGLKFAVRLDALRAQSLLLSANTASRYVGMLAFVVVSAHAWMVRNAVSASKDEIVWVNKEYGTLGTYCSLDEVIKELEEAQAAEKRGEWKDFYLEIMEGYYGDGHYISIQAKRPENAVEKAMRLNDRKEYDRREKEQYERLREKYGSDQEKKG